MQKSGKIWRHLKVSKNSKKEINFGGVYVKGLGNNSPKGKVYVEDFIPSSTINKIELANF